MPTRTVLLRLKGTFDWARHSGELPLEIEMSGNIEIHTGLGDPVERLVYEALDAITATIPADATGVLTTLTAPDGYTFEEQDVYLTAEGRRPVGLHIAANGDVTALGQRGGPKVAYGLTKIGDHTPGPFLDIMKQARQLSTNYGDGHSELIAQGYLTADGWPEPGSSFPPGETEYHTGWFFGDALPGMQGDYLVMYEGVGTLQGALGGTLSNHDPVAKTYDYTISGQSPMIKIKTWDAVDPIRKIKVVKKGDDLTRYLAGETFRPGFMNLDVSPSGNGMALARMMDWARTNSSTIVAWSDVTPVSHQTYAIAGHIRGVPPAIQAQYCSEKSCTIWPCIPHLADDNCILQYVQAIHDNLDPSLEAWFELGNEFFNYTFGFDQAADYDYIASYDPASPPAERSPHVTRHIAAVSKPGGNWGANKRYSYVAFRAHRIRQIIDQVFADRPGKAHLFFGTHTVNTAVTTELLNAPAWQAADPAGYVDPKTWIDGVAVTTYFGLSSAKKDEWATRIDSGLYTQAQNAEWLRDQIIATGEVANTIAYIKAQRAAVPSHLKLIVYEGQQHVIDYSGWSSASDEVKRQAAEWPRSSAHAELCQMLVDELWIAGAKPVLDGPYMVFGHLGAASEKSAWIIAKDYNEQNGIRDFLHDTADTAQIAESAELDVAFDGLAAPAVISGRVGFIGGAETDLDVTVEPVQVDTTSGLIFALEPGSQQDYSVLENRANQETTPLPDGAVIDEGGIRCTKAIGSAIHVNIFIPAPPPQFTLFAHLTVPQAQEYSSGLLWYLDGARYFIDFRRHYGNDSAIDVRHMDAPSFRYTSRASMAPVQTMAVTYDGATITQYIDNVFMRSDQQQMPAGSDRHFRIHGGTNVAQMLLYNRALTPEQISRLSTTPTAWR